MRDTTSYSRGSRHHPNPLRGDLTCVDPRTPWTLSSSSRAPTTRGRWSAPSLPAAGAGSSRVPTTPPRATTTSPTSSSPSSPPPRTTARASSYSPTRTSRDGRCAASSSARCPAPFTRFWARTSAPPRRTPPRTRLETWAWSTRPSRTYVPRSPRPGPRRRRAAARGYRAASSTERIWKSGDCAVPPSGLPIPSGARSAG
mmetsp:Transcript_4368/g.19849  ORF Transcript_4368/g.19849 Transcript_4368/m.19849 type:complete len:200 (+) Transcript_4368:617-1216(+)